MSPVKTPASNLKAKSPSKLIQQGVDTNWGGQQGTTDPKQAIAQKRTDHPVKVNGDGK